MDHDGAAQNGNARSQRGDSVGRDRNLGSFGKEREDNEYVMQESMRGRDGRCCLGESRSSALSRYS